MSAGDYAEIPITVAEGGGLYETWTLQSEDGTPLTITGDTFTAYVKASYSTSAATLVDISPSVSDGAAGQILFNLDDSDASLLALANGEYVYDLFREPSGQPRLKIAQGAFVKTASATDF